MDNVAAEFLKDKLLNLNDIHFQNAMDKIFSIIYENDFTQIKQKRDKGCDGILFNNDILAAYAPEKYNLNDFKKKTTDDYNKYKENWEKTHNKWTVVTNKELTASMLRHINKLKDNSEIICVNSLLKIIINNPWSKTIKVFRALDIPDRYYRFDLFNLVIEDIIEGNEVSSELHYHPPLYINDKIELNINDEEQQSNFIEEYEEYFSQYPIIENVLSNYSSDKVLVLRRKIKNNYNILQGNLQTKMFNLTNILSNEREDDIYKHYIRILLFYFFEQCLIGIKTQYEKESKK